MEKKMKKSFLKILIPALILSLALSSCSFLDGLLDKDPPPTPPYASSLEDIPEFDGKNQYVIVNGNVPFFTDEPTDSSYETYSELDSLGRCGVAIACIGIDLMPTEDRGDINNVTPSGWHSVKYDVVPNKYLYNRCHLIGFQLSGENDNPKNLITGTRNMNNEGMLPFENMVADYVKETEGRVLYRVTPIFKENELVARGVLMEAKSVDDDEICFCVYVYNNQPGVTINYKTGESALADDPLSSIVTENHDLLEITPAALSNSIIEIYEEREGETFSGCLIVVEKTGYGGVLTVVVDIDGDGSIVSVVMIKHSESASGIDGYTDAFVGKDKETADDVEHISGATTTTTAVRDAVVDALLAFEIYTDATENGNVYIANTSSKKFHKEGCTWANKTSEENKLVYRGYASDLIAGGYAPCGTCKPE